MQKIIDGLPYTKPFLFVDSLLFIDENRAIGTYNYDENLDFYKGHFVDRPVTPGVILTETMAQIGLVCLGIFLLNDKFSNDTLIALTSSEITFLKPVFPNETVTVYSEKMYFRFGKLKCKVWMENEKKEVVCKGFLAGMMK